MGDENTNGGGADGGNEDNLLDGGAGENQNGGGQGDADGGGSQGALDWTSTLSPDVRARVQVSEYKSPDEIGVALINAEKKIGAKGVIVPGENATDEDWNKFYNELGRPETAEAYELGDFKTPENLPWDGEAQTEALEGFHGLGLNSKQAEGVLGIYLGYVEKEVTKAANEAAAAETALRKELGTAYDAKMDLANRVVRHFGGEDLVTEFKQNGQGRNAQMIKTFIGIGEAFGEDGPLGDGGGGGFAMSPAEAQAEIQKLESDPENGKALTDQSHPKHGEVMKRRGELFKMAYPAEQKS